eukprot:3126397-Prymnesium_polylepis.1
MIRIVQSSLLSTIRLPTIQSRRRLDLVTDGYSIPAEDEASLRLAVQNVSADQLARCSTQQQSALLACATASYNDECINGENACQSADALEETKSSTRL